MNLRHKVSIISLYTDQIGKRERENENLKACLLLSGLWITNFSPPLLMALWKKIWQVKKLIYLSVANAASSLANKGRKTITLLAFH